MTSHVSMKTKPSDGHKIRNRHNWLVYDLIDLDLLAHVESISGCVYDLGCGEMPYRSWFMQYAEDYIGVDWSGTFHQLKADIVADLNRPLPIKSSVANTVISFSVLEHLYNPQKLLNEAFRILVSGGSFMIQIPWQWHVHEAPYDYFRYTPFGIEYLLKEAGFRDVQVSSQGGFFSMIALKLNYFSLRLIRGPRFIRWVVRSVLAMFWFALQKMAPYLDKLDKNWSLEAPCYFIVARKP